MKEIILNLLSAMSRHPEITDHVKAIKKRVYTPICDLAVAGIMSHEPIAQSDLGNYLAQPIEPGQKWAEQSFDACWLHLTGDVPQAGDGKHLVVLLSIGAEGLAYVDGEPRDIVTPIMSVPDVLQPPTGGKHVVDWRKEAHSGDPVDIWVDCGNNGIGGHFVFAPKLHYARLAECDDAIRDYYYDYLTLALLLATEKSNTRVRQDRKPLLRALSRSYRRFALGDLQGARQQLDTYYSLEPQAEPMLYTLVGHAHLDLAWLWPVRETKRKALRTFTNALSMIEQCPDYVFGASQAQMFDWIRQSHPHTFAKLQQAVQAGNIEIQGGMWTECDCNVPCGESLIRQFVYGDKFFLTHFGRTSDVVWLPDAFGFPATLPQIIAGVGKHYFATIKLYWNAVNTFPYQSFVWEGPDGSRVVAHLSPERTYTNDGTPLAIAKAERHNTQKETGHALVIYGVGDGGGGPGEGHVQVASRMHKVRGLPPTKLASASSFFDQLARVPDLPEYRGELYLEFHQGTYTSQAANKQYNRQCENALHTLDWLAAVYGRKPLAYDEMWQTVLFNQFHDILPGSGIERVHRESREQLEETLRKIQCEMVDVVDAPKGYAMLNPSPFARAELTAHHGKVYLASAQPYATATFAPGDSTASVGDDEMENNRIKIRFRKGEIVSYIDKVTGKDYCAKVLGRLNVYHDKPAQYDAWNIDPDYRSTAKKVRFVSSKNYCEPTRAVTELNFVYGKSRIMQKVSLGYGTKVTFETYVEWHEEHTMLRAEFYPAIYADEAECDIQFGAIRRSTFDDTSQEKAQFEVCAHKYVALEDDGKRFAVYSREKYGWRVKDNHISLALLRSPVYPDPTCDRGNHEFSYAMDIPADEMSTVAAAYNFNYPMIIMDKSANIEPICQLSKPNVIVETVKLAEEGEGIVLRVYERLGHHTICPIKVPGYDQYFETDMEEHNPVPIDGVLRLTPYQIKTILCRRSAPVAEDGE